MLAHTTAGITNGLADGVAKRFSKAKEVKKGKETKSRMSNSLSIEIYKVRK